MQAIKPIPGLGLNFCTWSPHPVCGRFIQSLEYFYIFWVSCYQLKSRFFFQNNLISAFSWNIRLGDTGPTFLHGTVIGNAKGAFCCGFLFNFLFIFEWKREPEWGKGQRERETQKPKRAPGSWAIRTKPDAGLKPTNREIMTLSQSGRSTNWATQAPHVFYFVLFFNRK